MIKGSLLWRNNFYDLDHQLERMLEKHNMQKAKQTLIHKMSIAQKEAYESEYWLELLHASEYLDTKQFDSIKKDLVELLKLLSSIIISSKQSKK